MCIMLPYPHPYCTIPISRPFWHVNVQLTCCHKRPAQQLSAAQNSAICRSALKLLKYHCIYCPRLMPPLFQQVPSPCCLLTQNDNPQGNTDSTIFSKPLRLSAALSDAQAVGMSTHVPAHVGRRPQTQTRPSKELLRAEGLLPCLEQFHPIDVTGSKSKPSSSC